MLAWTSRIRVGIGLMPVPLRNVAITAMEIATIEGLFPAGSLPAIGHGVQRWMGQVGARAESPLTLLGEYADALRGCWRVEQFTVEGRYVTLDRSGWIGRPRSSHPCSSAGRDRRPAARRGVWRGHDADVGTH